MSNQVTGSIRTVVPLIIGALLTSGANWVRREYGVDLPSDPMTVSAIASSLTAFLGAVWYLVFSSLERRWPVWGVFLGWPKAPRYDVEGEVTRREDAEEPPQGLPAPRRGDSGSRSTPGADPLP